MTSVGYQSIYDRVHVAQEKSYYFQVYLFT